jgi:hypothetical protein
MNILCRRYTYLAVVAFLFFASSVLAQTTASFTLTSPGNNALGGVYVDPYTANINGVSTTVICDDWVDESYVGESWTAYVNTLQPLSNGSEVKWGNNQPLYDQVAWLSTKLLSSSSCPKGGSCDPAGDISYAIWQLTYCSVSANNCNAATSVTGTPFANLDSADLANAQWWLGQAESQSFTSGEFSNFLVYTPDGPATSCPGGLSDCPDQPPQEFLVVTTPESSVTILLSADLLGLLGLAVVFRRRLLLPSH